MILVEPAFGTTLEILFVILGFIFYSDFHFETCSLQELFRFL
ncbi:hypothetical protein LEP1GSC124_1178 [Leptospira interrogans serovar Pyrogenes str. 200701872]|uniref:Uncharacterized protein n=1 Tax=Leptospira interrogans serovar Pyrogenes str. 200701872 TaxID=1193029 RepID=M6ZQH2_LEPIR|nr:hypothetical protein LEP1GSC124_1178 [Leptospira interrogans serovar Pyrogenes str. 200701872]